MRSPAIEVEQVPLASLKAYDGNAKRHDRANVDAIAESIKEFGFRNPILAWHNEDGVPEIVAGHGRAAAAKKLCLEDVPVVFVDDLTDAQRRMLTLADNQTTLMTGWDEEQLAAELDALRSEFDVSEFGFDDFPLLESEEDKKEARYSEALGKVLYEPSGHEWEPSELFSRPKDYSDEIECMDAPEGIKELCRLRNAWLCEFEFSRIADYYCSQATPEVQRVFEKLALVLMDKDKLVENGFSALMDEVRGDE